MELLFVTTEPCNQLKDCAKIQQPDQNNGPGLLAFPRQFIGLFAYPV